MGRRDKKTKVELLLEIDSLRDQISNLTQASGLSLPESLDCFHRAVETMQLGLTISDLQGTIIYTNPAEAEMHGYKVDELIGKHTNIFAPEELWNRGIENIRHWKRESINIRKDGTTFPVYLQSDPVFRKSGEIAGIITTCEDISHRKKAEVELENSLSLLKATLESTADGILVVDKEGNIISYNTKFQQMWKLPDQILTGGDSIEALNVAMYQLKEPEAFLMRVRELYGRPDAEGQDILEFKDGRCYERFSMPQRIGGRTVGRVWSFRDITERIRIEQRLQHEAFHDPLTKLPNRLLFLDRLGMIVARRRKYYLFAVLFLDLDRFKVVNDSLGHMAGDELLKETARKLSECIRPGDTVARFGGDEFAILLDDIRDVSDATRVAERIQFELQQPVHLYGQEIFTTASIGIALGATGYDTPDELLRDADTAMYRAKMTGKAHHEVFDKEMHSRAVALLKLETDLRHALERNEFSLYYQPILSLQNGRLIGFESLIRWFHPERGLLLPSEFIPMAEETGLIIPLGRWVLREACKQMKLWQAKFGLEPELSMSVNLSGKQFTQRDFIHDVLQTIQETGLDPSYLRLEITESVMIQNAELTLTLLNQLKNLNVRFHIDDFGTGYSSFSYLHHFPFDSLKIDRSFVSRIKGADESLEFVRAMIVLATNLGKDVIAEGIETEQQLGLLKELNCHFGQGNYFSPPVEEERAERFIRAMVVPG